MQARYRPHSRPEARRPFRRDGGGKFRHADTGFRTGNGNGPVGAEPMVATGWTQDLSANRKSGFRSPCASAVPPLSLRHRGTFRTEARDIRSRSRTGAFKPRGYGDIRSGAGHGAVGGSAARVNRRHPADSRHSARRTGDGAAGGVALEDGMTETGWRWLPAPKG